MVAEPLRLRKLVQEHSHKLIVSRLLLNRLLLAQRIMTNFVRFHSTSLHSSSKLDRCGAALPTIIGVIVVVALLAGYVVINFFTLSLIHISEPTRPY